LQTHSKPATESKDDKSDEKDRDGTSETHAKRTGDEAYVACRREKIVDEVGMEVQNILEDLLRDR